MVVTSLIYEKDVLIPAFGRMQLFDLFVSLDASDEQLNYTTLYASAREGWAVKNRGAPKTDMTDLFETIIERGTPTAHVQPFHLS